MAFFYYFSVYFDFKQKKKKTLTDQICSSIPPLPPPPCPLFRRGVAGFQGFAWRRRGGHGLGAVAAWSRVRCWAGSGGGLGVGFGVGWGIPINRGLVGLGGVWWGVGGGGVWGGG